MALNLNSFIHTFVNVHLAMDLIGGGISTKKINTSPNVIHYTITKHLCSSIL